MIQDFDLCKLGIVASQCRHKVMENHKIWNICANTKSTGLNFCTVDVLQELHIVIVVILGSLSMQRF